MKLQLEISGKLRVIEFDPSSHRCTALLDGKPMEFEAELLRPGVLSLLVNGKAYRVVLEDDAEEPAILLEGRRFPYRLDDPRSLKARRAHSRGADGPRSLKASMPGRVVRVLVEAGATVEAHQSIVVIEAMKMQNELKAPKAGVVAELHVAAGDTVASGDVLAVIL
jgi:biotin carboxyl carrier protein